MSILLAIILTFVPLDSVIVDRVDVAELNHVHWEKSGEHTFSQWVFWEWNAGAMRVVDWRYAKCTDPMFTSDGGQWAMTWLDGETLRRVEADHFRETWTAYDVEVQDRARLPESLRRRLTRRGG